jgi:hypothetical protein
MVASPLPSRRASLGCQAASPSHRRLYPLERARQLPELRAEVAALKAEVEQLRAALAEPTLVGPLPPNVVPLPRSFERLMRDLRVETSKQ